MPDCAPPRWPARLLLATVAGAVVVAGFALLRYPANLRDPAAPAYLIALAVILAGYLGLTGWILRHPAGGWVLGTLLGLAATAAWSVEIWAGGPAKLDHATERTIGALFALLAVVFTVAAGILAGRRSRNPRAAFQAGSFAGLLSGAAVFIFAVVMTLTNLGVLASRDDYRHEFAQSHATDMATYLVGDVLAAGVAHLGINLVLGLLGAAIGATSAAFQNRARPRTPTT